MQQGVTKVTQSGIDIGQDIWYSKCQTNYTERKAHTMDPNATAAIMRDETADDETRLDAAYALLAWLERGGFPQSLFYKDGTRVSFGGNTAAKYAARQEADKYVRELSGGAR